MKMTTYRFKFFDGQVFTARETSIRDALRTLGLEAYNPVAYEVTEIAEQKVRPEGP